jgi:RimJ/RimL family protein N-acetyltransferase
MLESPRIRLVPLSLDLVTEIWEAFEESRRELSVFLSWPVLLQSREDVQKHIEKAIHDFETFEEELRFAILDQASHRFVGMIGLIIREKSVPFFEIGYWLRTSAAGKGYMTEAVHLLEGYAFGALKANRVEIRAAHANHKSCAVAKRCGYVWEAELANSRRLPSGELANTVIYRKLHL